MAASPPAAPEDTNLQQEAEPSALRVTPERLLLTPSMIPKDCDFEVKDSGFFKIFPSLPSPEEVREQAKAQHLEGTCPDKRRTFFVNGPNWRPPPVTFPHLKLFVKWGRAVSISEGQCLYAIGQLLKDKVPVPEIYGWRTDQEEVFLYMEDMHAQTLEQVWDTMESVERDSICSELRPIFDNLRQLEQAPEDKFIGNIARNALYDRVFELDSPEAGPFDTVQKFHNWFTFLPRRLMADPYSVPIEPFRDDLPDDSPIKFTHSDLHRSNILVTSSQPYRVVAIVDWEQSGWLPEYWEDRKAHWTSYWNEDWSRKYLPMTLCQFTNTSEPWIYYKSSLGC